MKPTLALLRNILLLTLLLSPLSRSDISRAATITMNASDVGGATSFNTGLHWVGGAAPIGGNTYQTLNFLLRTPTANTPVSFAGDSLQVGGGGGTLRIKSIALVTVNNLVVSNAGVVELTQPTGGTAGSLAGTMQLNGTAQLHAGILAGEANNSLSVSAAISGTGGFATTGSFGTISLTGNHTYSGLTTVNGGTLLVNGLLSSSPVLISSGTFGGGGILLAPVTNASGTLQPGTGANLATLTISNSLTLAGGTLVMLVNRTNAPTASLITAVTTLTEGGTLTVNNAGPALQIGDSFQLFNAASYTGSFATLNLPALNNGMGWSNNLAVNGSLVVVTSTAVAFGTWTNDASGLWSTSSNWGGGNIANGTSSNADFSYINITADRTVTLDTSRSIGNLLFGDTVGSQNWTLDASGGSVLTLAVATGSPSIAVNNNTATISAPLAGTQGLTKAGSGTAILTVNSSYTGATMVKAGALSLSGVGGLGTAAGTTLTVGNTAGSSAVLNILPGANVTNYNLAIGNVATAPGAVFQSGGALTLAQAANVGDFQIGNVTGGYGYYQLSGGALNAQEVGVGGYANNSGSAGVMDISGGTFFDAGYITVGRGTALSSGVLNVFGGGAIQVAGTVGGGKIAMDAATTAGSISVINIFNGGLINCPANASYILDLAYGNGAGTLSAVNLGSGGMLAIGGIAPVNVNPTALLNFNGGTLKATIANAAFLTSVNVDGVFIYPNGATIDDSGFAITGSVPLQAPGGYGVSSIAVTNGGSSYFAPPIVTLAGGGGVGVTASAQIDFSSGTVTNILISNPGSGYSGGDVLTVTFTGGGGSGAGANTPGLAVNTSGGLLKTGVGTLTLAGANTFAGDTTVSNGTLALGVGGSLASTNINVTGGGILDVSAINFTLGANQNLLGSGMNVGAVTTSSSSKIFAGADGGAGTNTFTGNLTFVAGASAQFDLSNSASGANDKIILNGASSVLTCGSASIGIKCGATLDQATDYTLFSLTGGNASIAGGFANAPVWTGTTPANAAAFSIVTLGNSVVLHYSSGATNPPAVTNLPASSVLATTATLNGQVTSTGGQFPSVKMYYGTSNGGTNPTAWTTNVSLGLQGGAFATSLTNLAANTAYYFAAFASNSAGATWAQPSRSFTTASGNPAVVTNFPASNVQGASAILNGQVVSVGVGTPNITLYYGASDAGANAGAWANSIYLGAQSGSFSVTAMGLVTNTTYYFTAAAVNADGTAWAQPSLSFTTLPTAPVVSVLTYHYDNARSGANTNEVLLTPSLVNTNNFGRIIKYVTDGYIYTQPLMVPGVNIPGVGVRNVVYVASEHDTVYAFDADSSAGANVGLLWKTNLGIAALSANGEFGARYCGTCFPDIVPEVGITGTPVIDPATGTLYVNVATREVVAGVSTNYIHRLHAINITNGTERSYSPVIVSGSVPGTGTDSVGGVMTFNGKQANQRAALTLVGGILYVAYAGYADTDPYHGWVFGYNATNLVRVAIFNTTPNATTAAFGIHAAEGGIWQGGHGLVVDANTNLYFITGNGSFSQNTNGGDYSDTVMKLATTNGLTVADYFTPYNQLALANADTDLGSVGPVLLPDAVGNSTHPHLLAAGGKSGTIYLLDRDSLGGFNAANNNQIVQSVIGATATIWSSPAYWNNRLFYQPANAAMKGFSISNATINATAFATAGASFGAYNGGPVVSANGTNNGIVWVINGVGGGATAVLYAYNATNLATLYSSSQLLARDNPGGGIKMITPTVANGKVYVGAQYALNIYGFNTFLATPTISPNGASYTNSVAVTLTEATPGATIYYTLDSTTPTTNSLLYTSPFVVTTTLSVSAIAVKSGAANSAVATASFINTAALGNGTGLLAQYWSNTTAVVFSNVNFAAAATLTRTDAVVNFNWSSTPPGATVGQTNFTARWTGCVQPQFTESYTFTTIADDGVRLWVNGQLLINDWTARTNSATNSGVITLNAQQLYNVRLEYFQNAGNAVAQFKWSSASTALGVIPQTQLYPFTNPPPSVVLTMPANGANYTAAASVTLGADADAPNNPIATVSFYANGTLLGTLSNSPYAPSYFLTATGLGAGSYALTAVATDGSGLVSTSAPVNIAVAAASGQPYGLTTNGIFTAFGNMPTTGGGAIPALLSGSGAFANTPARTAASGFIPYEPNTALWSDAAQKSRLMAVPNNSALITPDKQIGFATNNAWTFPAGTVFVKNFDLVVDETNTNVPPRRLETRLLVRDINGAVYGVTYKWRADNSDADLLATSLSEDITITNASGVRTQTWYYPSPADCLTCHTPQSGYVLGVNTRQLNGDLKYSVTGNTDNQLRTLNRLGLLNPAFNETNIAGYTKMAALTNTSASLELRARSYLDANCAQCHRPGGQGITFDARFDTPLAGQNLVGSLASSSLGIDNAHVVQPKDIWRSMLHVRMNTATNTYKMPPLARSLIDSNAVQIVGDWINSLAGTPALAPPSITPNGGTFSSLASVALTAPDTNAIIYFTLDSSLPTTNSLLYAAPLLLTSNLTLSASAYATGYVNSVTVSALFTVQPMNFTSVGFITNGQVQLGFLGVPGRTYVLQGSTNLFNWIPLNTNVAVTNLFLLTDPGASNFPRRFYRALQQ